MWRVTTLATVVACNYPGMVTEHTQCGWVALNGGVCSDAPAGAQPVPNYYYGTASGDDVYAIQCCNGDGVTCWYETEEVVYECNRYDPSCTAALDDVLCDVCDVNC